MSSHLSSYSARHTWATMAYYCEIHPGIISEAMGHSSINVTETYLKPFNDKKIDEANEKVISGSSDISSDSFLKRKTAEQIVYLNCDQQMYSYEQQFSISCLGSLYPQMHS